MTLHISEGRAPGLISAIAVLCMTAAVFAEQPAYRIAVGKHATKMQTYAAKELRKYLYQLSGQAVPIVTLTADADTAHTFVIGTSGTLPEGTLPASVTKALETLKQTGAKGYEGQQGYVLKREGSALYIAGTDDPGTLYGVYGLLDDHYDIGFYFSGDVLPETRKALTMPAVDEAKTPRQAIRGVLPWTNFPQSATVYSTDDWKSVIDRMARMRMNFLNIHTYNGYKYTPEEPIHNEMYHNLEWNGRLARNWNATARTGHGWGGPGWDVNRYLFGVSDLFDDYDFGTDATLHNDCLSNREVFDKGIAQFRHVIDYAHTRGVRVGLGIEPAAVMPEYGLRGNDPGVPEQQAKTILKNYPNLDVLLLYMTEHVRHNGEYPVWQACVKRICSTLKDSDMQIAVSGWGVDSSVGKWLQKQVPDRRVIVAPIARYSAGFEPGATYPGSRYWGGPWMEFDARMSSLHFYPYGKHLKDTVAAYLKTKDNMEGLFTLTWRLTDAIDPKIAYIAKAPWDREERYTTARSVYGEYVRRCYGTACADDLTALIAEDEAKDQPFGGDPECNDICPFTGTDKTAMVARFEAMIGRVNAALDKTVHPEHRVRLMRLRSRLRGEQACARLDWKFNTAAWAELQDDMRILARSFAERVDDISSLGNNVSIQNRFIHEHYLKREKALREAQQIKAPLRVTARGTAHGAEVTWTYESGTADGFRVYRNGTAVGGNLPASARSFSDTFDGAAEYTVTALLGGKEGTASVPQPCLAGTADSEAPFIAVVSPPESVPAGQPLRIRVRLLDGRIHGMLNATLHIRPLGSAAPFRTVPMTRRVKAVFASDVPSAPYKDTGIEYCVTVSDGSNRAVWPAAGGKDGQNAVCTVTEAVGTAPSEPRHAVPLRNGIAWEKPASGTPSRYVVYRGRTPDFRADAASLVTYVGPNTLRFADTDDGFDGRPLRNGTFYYRVSALDSHLNESRPSQAVRSDAHPDDPLPPHKFADAAEISGCDAMLVTSDYTNHTILCFLKHGGSARFPNMAFPPENSGINALSVTYAAQGNCGGKLQVWTDAPSAERGGTLMGTGALPGSGTWNTYRTRSFKLDRPIEGTHDIWFVFVSDGRPALYNPEFFRFCGADEADAVPADGPVFGGLSMLGLRADADSPLRQTPTSVENFGRPTDRLLIGAGRYAGDPTTIVSGGARQTALPNHDGIRCFGRMKPGAAFGFSQVPDGKLFLTFDKQTRADIPLEVRINDTVRTTVHPPYTGSDYSRKIFRVRGLDTGLVTVGGETVVFKQTGGPASGMNGVALFLQQPVKATGLAVRYTAQADASCSLWIDGKKKADLPLPATGGAVRRAVLMLPIDGYAELRGNSGSVSVRGIEFSPKEDTVAVSAPPPADGCLPANGMPLKKTLRIPRGTDLCPEASPDSGFYIKSMKINGVDQGGRLLCTLKMLNFDVTATAEFAPVSVFRPGFSLRLAGCL